jgi:fatty-acyl-CoA synthase
MVNLSSFILAHAPGADLAFDTLARHCRSKLAGFKVPKSLIIRDSLPRNPSGKLPKRVLRSILTA